MPTNVFWNGLFANPNISVLINGADGQFERVNSAATKLLGYEEEELLKLGFKDLTHPDDLQESKVVYQKILSGETDFARLEKKYIKKDGSPIWGRTNLTVLRSDNGEMESVIVLIEDITKDYLNKLVVEEYGHFFTLSLDLLCIANTEGYFVKVNPAFSRVLGYSVSELLNKPFLDFIHPEDVAPTVAEIGKLSEGIPTLFFENRYRKADGDYVWLSWTSSPFTEAGLLYAVAHDITDLKKTQHELLYKEQILKNYSAQLEKSNQELDQFAHVVSHDLKAPLRAINSLAGFIEEDMGHRMDSESRKHFDLIKKRTLRMENLIYALLTFARIGREEVKNEKIDLEKVVHEVVETVTLNKKVKFHITGTFPLINGSRHHLQQVFQNLIGNAVKYGDLENPIVEIGGSVEAQMLRFWVKDNGPGIHPDFHERIFEAFQTNQSRDSIESTGIGLYIVKKVIEETLAGKVGVTSELGEGATFWFTLPASILVKTA